VVYKNTNSTATSSVPGLPAVIVGACLLISDQDGYGTETRLAYNTSP